MSYQPPTFDREAEHAVIGALLVGTHVEPADVVDMLIPADFYDPKAGEMYGLLVEMLDSGHSLNPTAADEQWRRRRKAENLGFKVEFSDWLDCCEKAANFGVGVGAAVEKVRATAICREASTELSSLSRLSNDQAIEPTEMLERAEAAVEKMRERAHKTDSVEWSELFELELQEQRYRASNPNWKAENSGSLRTGYYDLDDLLGGIEPQQLIVIAARPSLGKTTFALNMMHRLAEQGIGSFFFTLEMSQQELCRCMIAMSARMPAWVLKNGTATDEQIKAMEKVARSNLATLVDVDDKTTSLQAIRAKARFMVRKTGAKCLFVDYMQLITSMTRYANREQAVSEVSRGLKGMARELEVPVVAVAQFNRESEKASRKPRMSDLRESGAIEQDANVVIALHRDDYQKTADESGERPSDLSELEVMVLKNRGGKTGSCTLLYNKPLYLMENFTRKPEPMEWGGKSRSAGKPMSGRDLGEVYG